MAHAFHQAAVPGDDPGAVVDEVGPVFGRQLALGHGEADAVGQALTQRPGSGLDARHMAELRVAGGLRTPLAEIG